MLIMENSKILTFGFSPCPNDTFIFYALSHGLVADRGLEFRTDLQDVETLNLRAKSLSYDLTKISVHAIAHLARDYMLLETGGAMGEGCGPLVVSAEKISPEDLCKIQVAIPGKYTTANLLFQIFTGGNSHVIPVPYDQIMSHVVEKKVAAGVIIHEGRFTYESYGLNKVIDLGEWWESVFSLPLPLGGILMKRIHGVRLAMKVEAMIRESLRYSKKHQDKAWPYIKENAQEMEDEVIKNHIELYVNEFSEGFGPLGRKAILTLLDLGAKQGLLPEVSMNLFTPTSI